MKKSLILVLFALLVTTGCSDDTSEAVRNISNDLRNNPTQLSNIIFTSSDFTISGSGKVLKTNCKDVENDGKGRYLVQCDVVYNPTTGSSYSTDVTKENTVIVMAVFINNGNGTFSKKYERKAYTEVLKANSCWGKDKSYGLKCG